LGKVILRRLSPNGESTPKAGVFSKQLYNFPVQFLQSEVTAMSPEERERMNWLCARIQEEKDQKKFTELVMELNALF
jgi:hypothetical protein